MDRRSHYDRLGGEAVVRAIAKRFYDRMEAAEPALTALHPLDEHGRLTERTRERFALFFIGWLGGPATYVEQNGHPRLRMRHGHVVVDEAARDAWMRCMSHALDAEPIDPALREELRDRLGEVATFLRNR